ncbi:hypothetical protein [Cellvibrio sp.]|uniref:hypothetical protein n=1 Tax=Cellvibrio sp. TaxID=1965322 RepID=UPI00396485CE
MSKFWRCSGFARNQASLGGFLLFLFTLSGCGGGGGGETTFNAPASSVAATNTTAVSMQSLSSVSSSKSALSSVSVSSSAVSASSTPSSQVSSAIVVSSSPSSVTASSAGQTSSAASLLSSVNSTSSQINSSGSVRSSSSSAVNASSFSSASSVISSASSVAKILMPIEVIGTPGTVKSADFVLTGDVGTATHLWLQTHRLTWREDGEFAMIFNGSVRPGSKGSVRLNNGPWLGLSNATVTCEAHEAAYGCLNGTYASVRLRVPLSALGEPGLKAGINHIEFRFDATDGISSGWRVLAFMVKGTLGDQIAANSFVSDNPDTWVAPKPLPSDVAEGKQLWESANLTDLGFSNSRHAINGKCKSCHARDGFDLAYFNYSNLSIVERAKFHGLSQDQGEKIASYIRSLDIHLPSGYSKKDAGRPWNPPYQPGSGLDAKPVELWAAGAGLSAVLENDTVMKAYMFPNGEYNAAILGARGFLNPREMPQAFQLPDWNTWVPTTALEDMVVDPSKVVAFAGDTPPPDNELNPLDMLKVAIQWLDKYRYTNMETDDWYMRWGLFLIHRWGTSKWPNANPGIPGTLLSQSDPVARARQGLAFNAWYGMRMWELMKKYKLEDVATRSGLNLAETTTDPVRGTVNTGSATRGLPQNYRSWPMPHRTLFELAPHFVGPNGPTYGNFVFSKPGEYLTTAWYTLEQIVNGGWHSGSAGIDWNYHPQHLAGMHSGGTGYYKDGPMHPYRWAWSVLWLYQTRPTDWAPNYFAGCTCGFMQRQIGLGLDVPFMDEAEAAGQITTAERKQLQEALALAFLGTVERYTPNQWTRRVADDAAHLDSSTFETVNYAPRYNPLNSYDLPERGYQADAYYLRIKTLKDRNYLTASTLNRLVNWGASIWPKGEWELLRP